MIIRALSEIEDKTVKYIICGQGELNEYLERLIAEKNLQGRVKLLGYRSDIRELLHMADVFAFPSKREGLGLAALEAMAAGLPLITSYVGGIKDFVEDGKSGYCIYLKNVDEVVSVIYKMFDNEVFLIKCGSSNYETVKKFDIKNTNKIMSQVYLQI